MDFGPNLPQKKFIESVTDHPNYMNGRNEFDYSIVKLTEPLDFNTNVKPACLPTADFAPDPGNVAVASGFGRLSRKFAFDFHISSVVSRNNQRNTLICTSQHCNDFIGTFLQIL